MRGPTPIALYWGVKGHVAGPLLGCPGHCGLGTGLGTRNVPLPLYGVVWCGGVGCGVVWCGVAFGREGHLALGWSYIALWGGIAWDVVGV